MGFSSKHLTVFSPETVNIKKLANLTANTKNFRQITLNTKPHSDPLIMVVTKRYSKYLVVIYLLIYLFTFTNKQKQTIK